MLFISSSILLNDLYVCQSQISIHIIFHFFFFFLALKIEEKSIVRRKIEDFNK